MKRIIAVSVFAMVVTATVQAFALTALPQTWIGTVESISENTLAVISEKEDTQRVLEIHVNNETQFEESDSLDSLQKGDLVDVKYTEDEGQALAITITKIKVNESAQQ